MTCKGFLHQPGGWSPVKLLGFTCLQSKKKLWVVICLEGSAFGGREQINKYCTSARLKGANTRHLERIASATVAHLNRDKIESNLSVPGIQGCH